jgi:hypothetical protein
MRCTRVTLGVVALGMLACGSLLPRPAPAQMLKCESHALAMDDEASLRAKTRAVLPETARSDTMDVCRNPNTARAVVLTRKTSTSEDVVRWRNIFCLRQTVLWNCEAPTFNQLFNMHASDAR